MIAIRTRCLVFLTGFFVLVLPAYSQWTAVSPISVTHNFTSVSFADEMTGFAVGFAEISTATGGIQGLAARTTDGGATWKTKTFNQIALNSVYAVDANTAYVAGRGRNCGCPVLVRTTDGGTTWSEQQLTDVAGGFQAIDFYDADIGAVGGGNSSTGSGFVYRVRNGELSPAHQGELMYIARIDMVSPDRVFAAGGEEAEAENTIFSTGNFSTGGSVLWENVKTFGGFVSIGSLDFTDEQTGYAALTSFEDGGFAGYIYKTTNSGVDWTSILKTSSFTLACVDFLDADNAFAVGAHGAIVHTTDGGGTWDENITFATQSLAWVDYVSPAVAYAVGTDGTIMKYTGPSAVPDKAGIPAEKNLRVEIVPNPAVESSSIRVVGEISGAAYRLRLSNVLGREVRCLELNNGWGTLQTNALPPGTYFYRLLRGEEVVATGGVVVQ